MPIETDHYFDACAYSSYTVTSISTWSIQSTDSWFYNTYTLNEVQDIKITVRRREPHEYKQVGDR